MREPHNLVVGQRFESRLLRNSSHFRISISLHLLLDIPVAAATTTLRHTITTKIIAKFTPADFHIPRTALRLMNGPTKKRIEINVE